MSQEIITSQEARKNILNNDITLNELKNILNFNNATHFDKKLVAEILCIETSVIDIYIEQNSKELYSNGYKSSSKDACSTDTFSFRAFINLVMLMKESEKATEIRSIILDVAIGVAARLQGGYADFKDTQYNIVQESMTKAATSDFSEFLKEHSQKLQAQIQEKETLDVFKRLKER